MSAFLQELAGSSTAIQFAIEYACKSTAFILLAMALLPLIRAWTPAMRYHVLRASFIGLLLLGLLWPILPSWQASSSGIIDFGSLTLSPVTAGTEGGTETAVSTSPWFWPLLIWLSGVIILGLRFIIGQIIASRLIRSGRVITNADFLISAEHIARDLGIKEPIRYVVSETVRIPMVVGIFRPTILIPPDLPDNIAACGMILRHEAAHVKRNDVFWITLASLISIVLWFNPLVWVLKRRMIIESEYACDDYVLIAGGQAQTYAEQLLLSARRMSRLPRLITAGSSFNSELEGRIMSILAHRKRAISVRGIVNIGIIAAMCLLILPLAGMSMMSDGDKEAADKKIELQKQQDEAKLAEKKKQHQLQEEQLKQKQQQMTDQELKQKQSEEKEFNKQQTLDMELKKKQMAEKELKQKEQAKKEAMQKEFQEFKQPPELIHEEQPEFPEELKAKGIEGTVLINAFVTKDGVVKTAKVENSSGNKLLDKSALEAAYKNKFKAALDKNGDPVGTWVSYKVSFKP